MWEAVFASWPVDWDAAAVWLIEDGFTECASSELQIGALRKVVGRERQEILSIAESLVERSSALSGEYAPDSTTAEGSSIVDKPGEY